MATELKDYCVVTMVFLEFEYYIHTYGPYTAKEAHRMARQLETPATRAFCRKLQDKNEVTAKPRTPKGY